jgi:phenylalanyl-tRNA synthetase alpha chain
VSAARTTRATRPAVAARPARAVGAVAVEPEGARDRAPLPAPSLARALAVRDLTDPAQGPHALQLLLDDVASALAATWGSAVRVVRGHPIVPVDDAFDRLRYPADAAARDARYTRYVGNGRVLRTMTTSLVLGALDELARDPVDDVLLVCPGITYRRDAIDRLHTGTPHQVDLWRLRRGRLGRADLRAMVDVVGEALLPGRDRRVTPAVHPYTTDGLQIDVVDGDGSVEVGECGLAHPELLAAHRLPPVRWTGLAMGLGLDRILMLRKGIPDIRLLRSDDPRVAEQMLDLAPYRLVSTHPPVVRDLSVAVDDADLAEDLGDRVREALADAADAVEAVELVATTPGDSLSPVARERLGLRDGQRNALVRVTLRHPTRTLRRDEANALRDRVWAALHRGDHAVALARSTEERASDEVS